MEPKVINILLSNFLNLEFFFLNSFMKLCILLKKLSINLFIDNSNLLNFFILIFLFSSIIKIAYNLKKKLFT